MNNLKILRTNNNLTLKALSNLVSISPQMLSCYELGEIKPPIDKLVILANYYNVSLDYLCGRQYNNQVGFIPEERKDLVKLVINLTDTKAERVYGYAKALSEQD